MSKLLDSGILNKILTLLLIKSCLLQISAKLNLHAFTLMKRIIAHNIKNAVIPEN